MEAYPGFTDEELKEIVEEAKVRIVIVGVGGAGGNMITRLMSAGVEGVETVAINTDSQDLLYTRAHRKILIGKEITGGLGAGNDPKIGEEAAVQSKEEIRDSISSKFGYNLNKKLDDIRKTYKLIRYRK